MTTITVPTIPNDPKISGWRRTIRDVECDRTGGDAITGTWLEPGDTVTIPAGTLILAVDKTTTGWAEPYGGGKPYPVQDATVTIHLVGEDGLAELWRRHYKTAKSALGATTIKRLLALLDAHPAPSGTVHVVEQVRRPNRRAGDCRWCGGHIAAGSSLGHLVGHGDRTEVEHWKDCPARSAKAGTPCAVCGITVTVGSAQQYLNRETGQWETRHLPHLRCATERQLSQEEAQQRAVDLREQQRRDLEAKAANERKAAQRREKAAAKRREARAAELERIKAETERIATIPVVERTTTTLNDKGLGDGVRARLLEHTDTLKDGSTVTRWEVTTTRGGSGRFGEDYDPEPDAEHILTLDKTAAQDIYRGLKWQPTPRPRSYGRRYDRGCPGLDVRHCYGCGSLDAPMNASTGPSCEDCYDDLADAHGQHALRYHR